MLGNVYIKLKCYTEGKGRKRDENLATQIAWKLNNSTSFFNTEQKLIDATWFALACNKVPETCKKGRSETRSRWMTLTESAKGRPSQWSISARA